MTNIFGKLQYDRGETICDAIFARKKKRKGNLLQKFRELSGERKKKNTPSKMKRNYHDRDLKRSLLYFEPLLFTCCSKNESLLLVSIFTPVIYIYIFIN